MKIPILPTIPTALTFGALAVLPLNASEVIFSHTFDGVDNEVGPALQAFDNGAGTISSDIVTGQISGSGNGGPGFNTVSGIDLSAHSEFTIEFVVENNYSAIVAGGTNGTFFGVANSTTANATDGSALYNNAGSATGTALGLQVGPGRGTAGADLAFDEVAGNGAFTEISAPADDATDGYSIFVKYAEDAGTGNTEVTITSTGLDANFNFSTVVATDYSTLASLVTPNTSAQNGVLDFSSITIRVPSDVVVVVDTDNDGTPDETDTDDDNDGVLDGDDAFPLDASESVDSDGDGTGDNADTDDDNDGVIDTEDAFPNDAAESVDTDGDGTGNNADTDDDGDGVADVDDAFPLDPTKSVEENPVDPNAPRIVFSHSFDGVDNEVGPALQEYTNGAGDFSSDFATGELSGNGTSGAPGFNTVSGIDLSEFLEFTIEFVVDNNYSGISGSSFNGTFFGFTNSPSSNAIDGSALYNNAGSADGTSIGFQVGPARGDAGADYVLDQNAGNGVFTAIGAPADDDTDGYTVSINFTEDADSGNTAVTITSTGLDVNFDFSTVAATNYAALTSLVTPNVSAQGGTIDLSSITITAVPVPFVDSDDDGVADSNDAFPNDPAEDSDFDADGTGDNADDLQELYLDDPLTFSGNENPIWKAVRVNKGTLNITGGILEADALDLWDCWVGTDASAPGVVNQSGGDVTLNFIEIARSAASEGTYRLSGGSLLLPALSRAPAYNLFLGRPDTGAGGGDGTVVISGGAFQTRAGVALGGDTAGTGIFSVVGSGASSIDIGGYDPEDAVAKTDGAWLQNAGSTLNLVIDATDGITPILINDSDASGDGANVEFASGALLDPDFIGDFSAGTWSVMTWTGTLTDDGLALTDRAADDGWSFSFDDLDTSGTPETLSVTFALIDVDGDNIPDGKDIDDDNDGTRDVDDAFPLDPNETQDTDGDNIGNNADTDDDNDGVLDGDDDLPLDSTETVDSDSDGQGDNADTDDDNDGVLDTEDAFPFDATESADADGDGVGDNADTDDDNDGVLDEDEVPVKLINISTRAYVLEGEKVMIAGFVVKGAEPIKVLIQAVGPELDDSPYFVEENLDDPQIALYDANGVLLMENDDWDSDDAVEIAAASDAVGSFVLEVDSKSSAILATLDAGLYTVILNPKDNVGGVALVEVYEVPAEENE